MQIIIDIPENVQEVAQLTEDEKIALINEVTGINDKIQVLITSMVEDIIYPIIKDEHDVNKVTLDPTYEYNDEGYCANYVMPYFNDDWDSYSHSELKETVDNALSEIAHLLPKNENYFLTIDLDELRFKKENSLVTAKSKKNIL